MIKNAIYFSALFLVLLFTSGFTAALADDSGKVTVHSNVTCAGQKLQLNGFGDRTKFFLKLYVATLYVQDKLSDAGLFLEMTQASCMRLHITSSKITSEKMVKATREGFEKATKGDTAPIENEIDTFLSWLKQPIKKGDVLEFAFVPHNAIHVSKNASELGVIESKQFASALFSIWLGDAPAQASLKAGLLGQ